jgi:hypothetical protein
VSRKKGGLKHLFSVQSIALPTEVVVSAAKDIRVSLIVRNPEKTKPWLQPAFFDLLYLQPRVSPYERFWIFLPPVSGMAEDCYGFEFFHIIAPDNP